MPDGLNSNETEDLSSANVHNSGPNSSKAISTNVDGVGLQDALKTRAFWIISIGHAQALLVVSVAGLYQVPYLEDSLGFSRNSAARIVMLLTAVNMFGQLFGGFLADRLQKNLMASATIVGHCLALIILAIADSYGLVIVYAVIQGLSWGVRTPVLTSMRGDYFGRKSFPLIMGTSQGIAMLGMVVGPMLVGYVADHYSYSLGFTIISFMTMPAIFLFLLLKKPVLN